jgi:hypothetical protein
VPGTEETHPVGNGEVTAGQTHRVPRLGGVTRQGVMMLSSCGALAGDGAFTQQSQHTPSTTDHRDALTAAPPPGALSSLTTGSIPLCCADALARGRLHALMWRRRRDRGDCALGVGTSSRQSRG